MREYALHNARALGTYPVAGVVTQLLQNWQARRAVRQLLELNDHQLNDIGLDRSEVVRGAHVPLAQNAVVAMEYAKARRLCA
jgi:uncharacterized protein YjiS (DUF1127 family)